MRRPRDRQGKEKMKLVEAARAAGWRVRETRDGVWLLHPDGRTTVATHLGDGSPHAVKRFRSDLRRAGLAV